MRVLVVMAAFVLTAFRLTPRAVSRRSAAYSAKFALGRGASPVYAVQALGAAACLLYLIKWKRLQFTVSLCRLLLTVTLPLYASFVVVSAPFVVADPLPHLAGAFRIRRILTSTALEIAQSVLTLCGLCCVWARMSLSMSAGARNAFLGVLGVLWGAALVERARVGAWPVPAVEACGHRTAALGALGVLPVALFYVFRHAELRRRHRKIKEKLKSM